ncbi:hypothetical protein AOLI_G00008230 [Acnodon oligacanthus]
MPGRWSGVSGQPGPFCEAVSAAESHPAVGGWLVAEQAGDLWECPLAPLLGESVGKVVESWHATTGPELVSECQANVGHMAVIQLPGRECRVHAALRPGLQLPLHLSRPTGPDPAWQMAA